MVMVASRLQVMSPEVYNFDASRAELHSPAAVKHDHRNAYPMHHNQASTTLRSNSLGSLLEQQLPDHEFALVARTPDGQYETLLSQNWQTDLEQIYSEQFRSKLSYARRGDHRVRTMSSGARGSFASDYGDYQDDLCSGGSRKRARARNQAMSKGLTQASIRISDRPAVRAFYERCFKDFQQQGCKIFGKAWVKMMEPKKQSNHPYVKGNETGKAPPWWPPIDGTKEEKVRHKEPDHLGKQERIILFCHILEIIVDPNHPARPRREPSHNAEVSIAELEQVTESSLADFYAASDKNAAKCVYMQDLFEVAKLEERYRRGEVAPDFVVQTMQGSRTSDIDPADDDEREMYSGHNIGASGMATPDTMVSAHESSHFRPDIPGVESYSTYPGLREPVYPRYGGQLPPTPEENQHYSISSPESYPPQSAPVNYQPVTAYPMHEPRRTPWQPTEYNPGQQLPPLNHAWSHGQLVNPVPMGTYNGWSATSQPQQQPPLLPPMIPAIQDTQEQAYHEGSFLKCESGSGPN